MNDWNLPWSGGCRCGQIRLQVSAPPLLSMACHCTGCQRMTASAFSLSVAIPSVGFSILKGQPTIGGLHGATRHYFCPPIGGLHGATRHYFCPHCMSWIFTRTEGMDEFVNLRATMLDDASWFTPFIETWTREKLLWATTSAVHSFETLPNYEEYASLIEQYTKQLNSK